MTRHEPAAEHQPDAGRQAETFTEIGADVPIAAVAAFVEAIGYKPTAVSGVVIEQRRVVVSGVHVDDDDNPSVVTVDGQRSFDRFRNVHHIAR